MTATAYQTVSDRSTASRRAACRTSTTTSRTTRFSNCFDIASQGEAVREGRVRPEPDLRARDAARRGRVALVHLRARRVRARAWTARSRSTSSSSTAEQAVPDAEHNGAVLVKGEPQRAEDGLDEAQARPPGAAAEEQRPTSFRAAKPGGGRAADLQGRPVDRALGGDLPDRLSRAPHSRRSP